MLIRNSDVLKDVNVCETRLVEGAVHVARMHERVEEVPSDAIEGRHEVLEGVLCRPEATAVVTEEVVHNRNVVGDNLCPVLALLNLLHNSLSTHVEPRILPACELASSLTLRDIVDETTGHDHSRVDSVYNAVNEVVGWLCTFFFDAGDSIIRSCTYGVVQLDILLGINELYLQQSDHAQSAEC